MAVGLNFGKEAANLLSKGSQTSATAMALGGAVAGGAYESIVNDGSVVGGAIMGAGLGGAAKFASNMHSIGAISANSSDFSLSHFSKGYNRSKAYGNPFNVGMGTMSANRNMKGSAPAAAEEASQGSFKQAQKATSGPDVSANPTSANQNFGPVGKNLHDYAARNGRNTKNAEAETRMNNANRRQNGAVVGREADQRLLGSRIGDSVPGTFIPPVNSPQGNFGPEATPSNRIRSIMGQIDDLDKKAFRSSNREFTDSTQVSRDRIQERLGASQDIRSQGYKPVYRDGKRAVGPDGNLLFK